MRTIGLIGGAGAALLLVTAAAPSSAQTQPMTAAEAAVAIMQYYPAQARAGGAGGKATLNCYRSEHNRLTGCEIASEGPPGLGFGDAALALAKLSVDNPKLSLPPGAAREPVTFTFSLDPPSITPNTLLPLHVYSQPRWLTRPSTDDIIRVYPPDAVRHHVSGYVVLTCAVLQDGKLARCNAEETQPGHGFDQAALRLVPMFQMTPGVVDGEPAPCCGTIRVPIRFAIAP